MTRDAMLGLDIGTSAVKAVLLDTSGREAGSASRPYALLTPRPGWVEQDCEAVWGAVLLVLGDIALKAAGCRIAGLAIAAQAGSLVAADRSGDPVYPMITWLDGRAADLVRDWQADGTLATVRRLSGWNAFPGLPLPSIEWLRRNRPDVHAAAWRFMGVADFFIHRLTGQFATDLSAATEMLLVDVQTGMWSGPLCALGGVEPSHQSEIGWSGRRVGTLLPELAARTGLPADLPVIAGGNDQPCAGLAMGMTRPGKVMLSTGTAWVLMSVVDSPSTESVPPWVNVYFHAVPGCWLQGQLVGAFGATVDWWLKQMWPEADNPPYGELDSAVAGSAPGSHGLQFFPLGGPSQMAEPLSGGGFVGLELGHTRGDMCRAVLEGCAYEVRWALEALRAAGIQADELWLAGGATRSLVWPQLLADVCGLPVVIAGDADWAALGAAVLAGWGAGLFPTLEAGIAAVQPAVERRSPVPAAARAYADGLVKYQAVARALVAARRKS
jgi:xylulokinase